MTKVMIFDTETTGMPLWDRPSEHPDQPHLVQYTAVLLDDETQMELAFDTVMVRPDGWTIPAAATAKHNITTEQAIDEGVPLRDAVSAYQAMHAQAELICGFNVNFDFRIMRIAMLRCGFTREDVKHFGEAIRSLDLMRQATPVCRIPPTDRMMATGRKTWKSPTLAEAVKILLNEELDDAHDSRADVLATMRLYQLLNRRYARPFIVA
jgi:DNA polymerase III subunit epsilon